MDMSIPTPTMWHSVRSLQSRARAILGMLSYAHGNHKLVLMRMQTINWNMQNNQSYAQGLLTAWNETLIDGSMLKCTSLNIHILNTREDKPSSSQSNTKVIGSQLIHPSLSCTWKIYRRFTIHFFRNVQALPNIVFSFSFGTKRQTGGGRGMLPGITTQEKALTPHLNVMQKLLF